METVRAATPPPPVVAPPRPEPRGFAVFPSRDVGLHPLDVGELERSDLPAAEQRLNVRFDPAPVHGEGRRLDRPIAPAKDAPRFRLPKIPVADLPNVDGFA